MSTIDRTKVDEAVNTIRALRILNLKSGVYTKKHQTQALTGLNDAEVIAVAMTLDAPRKEVANV